MAMFKYHFKFFEGCLPQILFSPFLNPLSHFTIPWERWEKEDLLLFVSENSETARRNCQHLKKEI